MIAGRLSDFLSGIGTAPSVTANAELTEFAGVTIDSRVPKPGSIFFAIKGEKHDGHAFVADAVKNGSTIVIVEAARAEAFSNCGATVVAVPDTTAALKQLARFYLRKINPRKIAITGSNGKTTAKNLIAAVMASRYRTEATRGNFNNQYGVPLSIFEFASDCEVAVMEFAMSTPGEIENLVELYEPEIRVILMIGPAHLESLGSLDAIAEAKFEILQHARPNDWAVLNQDDPHVRSRMHRYHLRKLTFGTQGDSELRPDRVYLNGSGHGHLVFGGAQIDLPILGVHHVTNCLATIAVAKIMEIPFAQVKTQIESFVPSGNRMVAENWRGVTIINDSYNSNPVSAKGALETIAAMHVAGRRIVVFGDMLELGKYARDYHAELGLKIAESKVDYLVVIGAMAEVVRAAAIDSGLASEQVVIAADHSAAVEALNRFLKTGDLLLLKASRGIKLEIVEQGLKATWGRSN